MDAGTAKRGRRQGTAYGRTTLERSTSKECNFCQPLIFTSKHLSTYMPLVSFRAACPVLGNPERHRGGRCPSFEVRFRIAGAIKRSRSANSHGAVYVPHPKSNTAVGLNDKFYGGTQVNLGGHRCHFMDTKMFS
jgi:hypothetical protein